jgi:hypothetical protein
MALLTAIALVAAAGLAISRMAQSSSEQAAETVRRSEKGEASVSEPDGVEATSDTALSGFSREHGPPVHQEVPSSLGEEGPVASRSASEFDAYLGPYTRDFLGALSVSEIIHCRQVVRDEQTRKRAVFFASSPAEGEAVTHEEYSRLALEDGDLIYLPRLSPGDEVHYFPVDPSSHPEIYALRDRARILQGTAQFVSETEQRRLRALESALSRDDVDHIETEIGSNGDYFRVWGTIAGRRVMLSQVATPSWM